MSLNRGDLPTPLPREGIRAYARRVGTSYRQARRVVAGKVYEREHGESRTVRRRIRRAFWAQRWRSHFPEDRHLSDAAIERKWRQMGISPPLGNTHSTHRAPERLRAKWQSFLSVLGLDPSRGLAHVYPETNPAGEEFA